MKVEDYLKDLDPYYIEKQAEHDEMASWLAVMAVIALGLVVIWAVVELIKWKF